MADLLVDLDARRSRPAHLLSQMLTEAFPNLRALIVAGSIAYLFVGIPMTVREIHDRTTSGSSSAYWNNRVWLGEGTSPSKHEGDAKRRA